jgi:hypothetical protein
MRQWRGAEAAKEREARAGRKEAAWRAGVLEERRRRGSVAVAMAGGMDEGRERGFWEEGRGGIILWIEGDRELFSGTRTVEIRHHWRNLVLHTHRYHARYLFLLYILVNFI